MEQPSPQALAAWDTENHFCSMAATGNVRKALAVLDGWMLLTALYPRTNWPPTPCNYRKQLLIH